MRDRVTVIPEDKLIQVDGEALFFDYTYGHIRAIQWHNGRGYIEYEDIGKINENITTEQDYNRVVLPYVEQWEAEKARLEQEKAEQEELSPDQLIEKTVKEYEEKIQARLDNFARPNYDGIMSCCTYASSHIPMYKIEGEYCTSLRDETWFKAYELINEMEPIARAGGHIPSWEEIEAQLPVPAWPEGSRNNLVTGEGEE